ncbi:carboxyl-terminal protease [Pedobacter sp. ISL-68]|uniref:S41 family peptidase n=1 Tax=unclassified Pedobacter TaxID=2628915 RepID=UPI001BEA4ADA|nr:MULTISPECIES: S41 family peptidase [unclassified Pedobacter]MBT2560155.1 carboxyl-terminal protease [Pedobacter sp. ISL-64]MBT2589134.1 carboxyl-terminal protease [Pedobacter sp. ISL-68]
MERSHKSNDHLRDGKSMMNKTPMLFIFWLCILSGCKKDSSPNEENISPRTGTRMQFTLDSIYLYAKQVYLWSDAVPSYNVFNPRNNYGGISPEIGAFRTELLDISQLKTNPATGKPFEFLVTTGNPKYSFLQNGTTITSRNAGPIVTGNAILAHSIFSSGADKVAYLALGSFPDLSTCKTDLDNAFEEFASAAPHHLVIDLRSNGGGYVETAEYVANLIAPSSLNHKIMFAEQFNDQMQNGNATILTHQPYLDEAGNPIIYKGRNATMADVDYTEAGNTYKFNKKGSLETINDVYFIVSGRTASASELLISSLKPHFNVKLIGEKTYGKPVGFFAINIDRYSVYLSSFLIRNANGWSDYFDGIAPDVTISGASNPIFGDPGEACLNKALELINGSAVSKLANAIVRAKVMQASPKRLFIQADTAAANFGMLEYRFKLKQ